MILAADGFRLGTSDTLRPVGRRNDDFHAAVLRLALRRVIARHRA